MSTVGDLASPVLRTTHINKGFFGARGLSLERGLMDLNPEEVRIKQELAQVCGQVIGIFDHSKWTRSALLSFVPTERVSAIVTDAAAPADLVESWRGRGVQVVVAQPDAAPSPARRPHRSTAP